MSNSALVFKVRRSEPELVIPARPTPTGLKPLSDIDDQSGLRYQQSAFIFYPAGQRAEGVRDKDPARAIKAGLAEALVCYYPWAGRLREGPARKLMVDCTAEGVVFVEADADVRLEQFGGSPQPPFPCVDDLLYNKFASMKAVLNYPIFTMQVTRLLCGGFIIGMCYIHAMADFQGILQFLSGISEFTVGADAPSILPVWKRELLMARDPPRVTYTHHEYDDDDHPTNHEVDLSGMVYRSFFFGPKELASLRHSVPAHLRRCSNFEILTACLWRCRTIALQFDNDEQVLMVFSVNARQKLNPPLPDGYYGNACAFPAAMAPAGKIRTGSLGDALEFVKAAKESVTEEYIRSTADFMVLRDRPDFRLARTFMVSDVSMMASLGLDFGWGKPTYAGPTDDGMFPHIMSYYIAHKNTQGEVGKLVQICLPADAMERFVEALQGLLTWILPSKI